MVRAYRPDSLTHALDIMSNNRTTVLAGGTDLMVKRRRWGTMAPLFELPVIFVSHLRELHGIEEVGDVLKIGASSTYRQLLASSLVPEHWKTVFSQIASPAIRNCGTIGGNICNASPAGDALPLLLALDASVLLQRADGMRECTLADFMRGPGETVIRHDELLCEIRVPVRRYDVFYYRKVGARRANSCAKVSFTGFAALRGGKISDIRISFGAVAPTIVRSKETETLLTGKDVEEIPEMVSEIEAQYSTLLKPIDDLRCGKEYRFQVSLNLLHHFLENALFADRE
jgi:CO/xanthine dehydrogenase FAD-binding subunit